MAQKIAALITIFAMAVIAFGFPQIVDEGIDNLDSEKIDEIRNAIIEQDVKIGLTPEGRIFGSSSAFGNIFNLSAILAGAPNGTASLTFIPLATILFSKLQLG